VRLTVMSIPAQIGMLAGPNAHTRNIAGTGICVSGLWLWCSDTRNIAGTAVRVGSTVWVHTCVSGWSTASHRVRARHSSLLLMPAGSRPSAAGNAALSRARLGLWSTHVRALPRWTREWAAAVFAAARTPHCMHTHTYMRKHTYRMHTQIHSGTQDTHATIFEVFQLVLCAGQFFGAGTGTRVTACQRAGSTAGTQGERTETYLVKRKTGLVTVKKCLTRPAHVDWSYCGASKVKGLSPAITQVRSATITEPTFRGLLQENWRETGSPGSWALSFSSQQAQKESRVIVSTPDHTRCNAALCTLVLCARSGAHSALSAQ